MASFTLDPFYLWEKSSQYQCYRGLFGPQNQYGRSGGEKILDATGTGTQAPLGLQPVASGYADCTIPASLLDKYCNGCRFTVLYCQFYSGNIYGHETASSYMELQQEGMHLNGGNQSLATVNQKSKKAIRKILLLCDNLSCISGGYFN
jgi:hypothetical protein